VLSEKRRGQNGEYRKKDKRNSKKEETSQLLKKEIMPLIKKTVELKKILSSIIEIAK